MLALSSSTIQLLRLTSCHARRRENANWERKEDMVVKDYLSTLLIGIGISTAIGCAVDPPPAPNPPLSRQKVQAVLACQDTIRREGTSFLNLKLKKLEQCADDVLELQMSLENQLITQDQFDESLPNVRRQCVHSFSTIKTASTRLVDRILLSCSPVEDILLGENDPLLFQGLVTQMGGDGFTSVEQLAAFICGGKELTVDFAAAFEIPRLHQLLSILGPEFVIDGDNGNYTFFLPVLPLDSRCNAPTSVSGDVVESLLGRKP
jgi:hypothetical protein